MIVFDPSMPVAEIQATVDAVNAQQIDAEMGTGRWALLFKPGVYGTDANPLQMKVGYYTEVAGLGASPADVTINGKIEVYNRCLEDGGTSNCLALVNFWRTLSNLTLRVNAAGQDGCRASANFWAVSQAVSIRRVEVTGGTLSLMDYCTAGPQYASGGYLADSRTGDVINGSQQQWLTRNSTIGSWSNGVWNQVFAGVEGAPVGRDLPDPAVHDAGDHPAEPGEAVPLRRRGRPLLRPRAVGPAQLARRSPGRTGRRRDARCRCPTSSWPGRPTRCRRSTASSPAASTCCSPRACTTSPAASRSSAPARSCSAWATRRSPRSAARCRSPSRDVPGVVVAGVTIDAGTVNSPALLRVGKAHGNNHKSDPADPTTLNDVYFRVGGPHVGKADVSLEVNSDDVLIDHAWVWRADHGVPGSVGWDVNTGRTGVVVSGDDVTATGLFVEHYQQYNVIWNGERGRTVFFQNELPYDPPNQAACQHDGVLGWAAYKVADRVRTHELWGGGAYVFSNVDPTIHASRGFEVPVRPGVRLHHVLTVNLGAGTIDHVVNDTGAPVDNSNTGTPSYVVDYP